MLNKVSGEPYRLRWHLIPRAISLAVEDAEAEQNEWRTLHAQVILQAESYILTVKDVVSQQNE